MQGINAETLTAAVCGCGIGVTFENIEVISGSIVGSIFIYGISGCGGSARNCINRANVTVERTYAAGIISNIAGEVSNCSNYGKITAGNGRAGGIAAGSNGFTQLINCANYGEIHVTGTVNGSKRLRIYTLPFIVKVLTFAP